MEFWNYLLRIIRREPSVATLVGNLDKQRVKLATAATQLSDLAAKKKAAADALIAAAKQQTTDAEWAQRVADKFADFIS